MSDLIENWDILDITVDLLNITGCLIPNKKNIYINAPNGRR